MAGAAILLMAGLIALSQLTTPSQDAAVIDTTTTTIDDGVLPPTTTTTIDLEAFSVDEIATGDDSIWVRAPAPGPVWPIDLIEHRGAAYLFGSTNNPQSRDGGGMSAWISPDGVNWTSHRRVIAEDHTIHRVVSTERGLIALGTRDGDGAPIVWLSSDALEWQAFPLPPVDATNAIGSFELNAAIDFHDEFVVVGTILVNSIDEIARALPEGRVGTTPSSIDMDFVLRSDVDDGIVEVYGPLGLHAFTMRLDNLDLGEMVESSLFGSPPFTRQYVWSSADLLEWEVRELDSAVIEELWIRPDGVLVAYGNGRRGSTISTTVDARTWTQYGRSGRAWIFQIGAHTAWKDTLVGGGFGEDLFQTRDGLDWQYIGTGDLLPDAINWRLGPVDAGSGRLAAVASALRSNSGPSLSPVTIRDGEASLTLDVEARSLQVEHPDAGTVDIPLWATDMSKLYSVDFIDETVTFTHPESGDSIAVVDFETLESAHASATRVERPGKLALLSTLDGERWRVQNLSKVIGESATVGEMLVMEGRIVMVSTPTDHSATSPEPPNLSVWVALD